MSAQDKRISAEPSKHFFIEILTRDVPVEDAVLDLVDNAVEAADRCASGGSLENYEISITFDAGSFSIKDNCGGIDVDTARLHAFCFGRDSNEGHEGSTSPIGRFGVGMKRSMFRLGKVSSVISSTKSSDFVVVIDTDKWLSQSDGAWHFDFEEVNEGLAHSGTGTEIEITSLHQNVRELLANTSESGKSEFEEQLCRQLWETYPFQLKRGLRINVNGRPTVGSRELTMGVGVSDEIRPFHKRFRLSDDGAPAVTLEIIAGVDERELSEGGWYVFCNNRLVLARNQDKTTGWGTTGVAKYSERFARFRGYALFHSADAKLVPWTTTKRNVDSDSLVYQQGLVNMKAAMTDVMSFLAGRDSEKKHIRDGRTAPDNNIVGRAIGKLMNSRESALEMLGKESPHASDFIGPKPATPAPNPATSIQFSRPRDQVERAKRALHAQNNRELGEKLFDMFLSTLEEGDAPS